MAGNKAAFDVAMKRAQDRAFENARDKALRADQRATVAFPYDPTTRTHQPHTLYRLQQWPAGPPAGR